MGKSFLKATCLRPSYSIRRQLLLGFGSSVVLATLLSFIITCILFILATDTTRVQSMNLLEEQAIERVAYNTGYVAKSVELFIENIFGTVRLISTFVEERIVGYPYDGWEEDLFVPFHDMESGGNKYPLKSKPLPLDWDITLNVNASNAPEHIQERAHSLHFDYSAISTASASYFMQGACDPSQRDPNAATYHENCTDDNNNVATGGAIHPTSTNRGLYEKSADIGVLLKPVFEALPDIQNAGVYFHNAGAGSMVNFPGKILHSESETYESIGCDWMYQTNPFNGEPFGTTEEIKRCHPAGTVVHHRDYNPMEQPWCRQFATFMPTVVQWYPNLTSSGNFPVGRSVFDRKTGHFIGCVTLEIPVESMRTYAIVSALNEHSHVAIVGFQDDKVFGDSLNSTLFSKVYETGFITKTKYEELRRGIPDFSREWSPEKIKEAQRNNIVYDDDFIYTYSLIPVPPNEYDPYYEAQTMVIHSVSRQIFNAARNVEKTINRDMLVILAFCFLLGVAGTTVTFFVVWFVSRKLTLPLLWIERVSKEIINPNLEMLEDLDGTENEAMQSKSCCHLKTEIAELVLEFRKMIKGFSGSGSSRVAFQDPREIKNELTWQSDYHKLYKQLNTGKRSSLRITSSPSSNAPMSSDIDDVAIVPAPLKINFGSNIRGSMEKQRLDEQLSNQTIHSWKSKLFWCILGLIVAPLVLTNLAIGVIVSASVVSIIPYWLHQTRDQSLLLEEVTLNYSTSLKADQAEMIFEPVVRDHYIMTRLAGWLHFGAIERSVSFCQLDKGTQECRLYPDGTCPLFQTNLTLCPCEWEDLNGEICFNDSTIDTRYLMNRHFAGQANNGDPLTGEWHTARFGPGINDSPETTSWWDGFSDMPGNEKGMAASGYNTTYARVRVSSALSVASLAIYSHREPKLNPQFKEKHFIGSMVAFEADGILTGYRGCNNNYLDYAHFQLTASNRPAGIDEDLCPLGKFGYDPRCRSWYYTGKSLFNSARTPIHMTAPYKFSVQDLYALTVTSPLVNNRTGEYIGQTLLDFKPNTANLFENLNTPLYFLISADKTVDEDAVIGPADNSSPWNVSSIVDILFRFEKNSSSHRNFFEQHILVDMKKGLGQVTAFIRTAESGEDENITLAYAPVTIRGLLPVSPDVFSSGATMEKITVFVLGIMYNETDRPWKSIEDEVFTDVEFLRNAYLASIAVVTLFFIILVFRITIKVTIPMITLLRVVQMINAGQLENDIPPLHGGSKEVHHVYSSFAKLQNIVRVSNFAFFSGNLSLAYEFTNDALKLFRKLHDEKAIGIASSNLGNTLHAMYSKAKYEDDCCSMIDGICILKTALSLYDEAINIAEKHLDNAVVEAEKSDFSQQLADRLFNRGLFLLLIYNDKCAPENSKMRALEDIRRAKRIDFDVTAYLLAKRLLFEKSPDHFCRLLRRISGLLVFFDDEEVRQSWDVNRLMEDADTFLVAAWRDKSAPLFKDVSRIGRLQQLESVAIRLELCKGNCYEAARSGMRMLVEDEYFIDHSFVYAASALSKFLRDDCTYEWRKETRSFLRGDLRRILKKCKGVDLDIGKCLVIAVELSKKWEGSQIMEELNINCLHLFDTCCQNDDSMGLVAFTSKGHLNVKLGVKSEYEGRQRTSLDIATTSTSDASTPALPYAIQMVIDSSASAESDSFVLLFTDGHAWNPRLLASIRADIERLNKERETKIHIYILGFNLQEAAMIQECKLLCEVSNLSLYADISSSNIHNTFETIRNLIQGQSAFSHCDRGLTMEKF